MARARPIDPDARRGQLVAAAREVFARLGYHAAGVSDVIEAAGVARGTFYNYFESKRAIFGAVLEELMVEATRVVEPIDVARPIPPQVRDNVRRIADVLATHDDLARLLFTEAAGVDAEGREALAAFYGTALARIERALRTGQALGIVRPCKVSVCAAALLGMLKEPVYQAMLRGERVDVDAVVDEIFALTTGGVLRAAEAR